MSKQTVATAVAPITPSIEAQEQTTTDIVLAVEKAVRISLTQRDKNGKLKSSYTFGAKGEDLTEFVATTCDKIVKVMELERKIATKGGKVGISAFTKSGEFELSITEVSEEGATKLLNNFTFSFNQLGKEAQAEVLVTAVERYMILTD